MAKICLSFKCFLDVLGVGRKLNLPNGVWKCIDKQAAAVRVFSQKAAAEQLFYMMDSFEENCRLL